MQTPDSQEVVKRFFDVINFLKKTKSINKTDLVFKYNINQRNFWYAGKNPSSSMFQVAWLTYMVREYGVSAEWLLTGEGDMLNNKQL